LIEGCHFLAAAGDEQRSVAGSDVGEPTGVCGVEHALSRTAVQAVALLIVVNAAGVPVAQAQSGGGVGEAAQLGELDRADIVHEEAKRAAGLDGTQLVRIADQPDLHPCRAGVVEQGVQAQCPGHAGLVDQHHVPATQLEECVMMPTASSRRVGELVEILVQVLGPQIQVVGEDLGGGRGGRGITRRPTASVPPGAGRAKRGRLPRSGRADRGDDPPVIRAERLDELALPVVEPKTRTAFEPGDRLVTAAATRCRET